MAQRIALIGPGAVGGTVAAWLAQDRGLDVTLCARTPLERLRVETPAGPIEAVPRVVTDPAATTSVDWVLIATKTYDADAAARWLPHLLGPNTRVAVLQNGVEHIALFSPYVEPERIVPAIVDIPAERSAPGIVRQRRTGSILVPQGPDGAAFTALFAHTPIEAAQSADFVSAAWRKLCVNCAGAVFVVTLKPAGVTHRDDIAALMLTLMDECAAVGRAEGARIDTAFPQSVIDGYRASPADSVNSMLADRLAGRQLEIDARNGVIVRLGARHGIATPLNAAMVALLNAI